MTSFARPSYAADRRHGQFPFKGLDSQCKWRQQSAPIRYDRDVTMFETKDTLLRLIALLRIIPRAPGRIATKTLLEKLKDDGFSVSLRTVQRDQDRLSLPFALQRDESSPSLRWSLSENAPIDLSAMDTPTALALYLAESHLQTLLPQHVLDQLAPPISHCPRLPRQSGKQQPSALGTQDSGDFHRQVPTALVERKELQNSYLSHSKTELKKLLIHPHGWSRDTASTTLLTSLNIVRQLWRVEDQNKHTDELAERAGKVYNKLRTLLGSSLDKAKDAYRKAHDQLISGKANLVKQVSDFRQLGVLVNVSCTKLGSAALSLSWA